MFTWWRSDRDGDAETAFAAARLHMVENQLARRDIRDPRVLAVMRTIPRHRFVPSAVRSEAYLDSPVSIGFGQTISQPYIVASMTEHLRVEPTHRVLEVGTGSGYQTAVLAALAKTVYSIELIPELHERAAGTLRDCRVRNTHLRQGDGALGWVEAAPFDRIIVTAAAVKTPPALLDQLADPGRMALPRLSSDGLTQELVIIEKSDRRLSETVLYEVRFVPLVTSATPPPP